MFKKTLDSVKESTANSLQRLENLAWMFLAVMLAVVATLFAVVVS